MNAATHADRERREFDEAEALLRPLAADPHDAGLAAGRAADDRAGAGPRTAPRRQARAEAAARRED